MSILAIDIGGTKFTMAVFDERRMVARESRVTDREGGREWLTGQIADIVAEWKPKYSWTACGIGFGGPVDYKSQSVVLSTHVGGWSGFSLPEFVAERAGVPVIMDNDANVGALGEAAYGAGKGCDPLFSEIAAFHPRFAIAAPPPYIVRMVRTPRELAERMAQRRTAQRADDGYRRETFALPREAARERARQYLIDYPKAAYFSAVESWRELPDGRIEFTMRRRPNAD